MEHIEQTIFREGMKALNMSSLNLVRTYILALENSGRIERTRLGNIDMLPKLRLSGVAITPIVGSIACGQPVDAVEQIEESVTLPRAIFGGGGFVYSSYARRQYDRHRNQARRSRRNRNAFYNCDRLTSVYYTGTKEDWNDITIDGSNNPLTSAKNIITAKPSLPEKVIIGITIPTEFGQRVKAKGEIKIKSGELVL